MSDKKEPQLIDFSKEDRNTIAEYIYSYNQDILIVSDAKDVLDVLKKHELVDSDSYNHLIQKIDDKSDGISSLILNIIGEKVSKRQGLAIMNEYYGGDYNEFLIHN